VVRLEQNYRSHGNILDAANALIANNRNRLGKNLWTAAGKGEPVRVFEGESDSDEARWIVEEVQALAREGTRLSQVAVLYRSNAQSRVVEHALFSQGIAYRVYGGLRFFERAEIKDALAYLRLIANRDDDASFERIVNLPTRGIGARTIDVLRDAARGAGTTLWRTAGAAIGDGSAGRSAVALHGFLQLIERLGRDIDGMPLHEQVDHVINNSGLIEHFRKDKADRGEARVENLEELVSAARGYEPEDGELPPLQSFLAHAALESGESQGGEGDDCVQMMTLHTAKGLEFPLVFLAGMEDGLFPHQRSLNDLDGIEEERRLCYVGITRAMKQLYLTYAEQRALEIGITIAGGAQVILLDEPTAGMSKSETRRFVALIRDVTQGKTLLTVEHDMGVVFGLADKIAVLVYGEVIAFDTPEAVRANARVQEAYLGVPGAAVPETPHA